MALLAVLFHRFCQLILFLTVFLALSLFSILIIRGMPSLNLSFIMDPMANAGLSGGVRYQILGSLMLILSAAIFATPVALSFCYCFQNIPQFRKPLITVLYALNSVPSIVLGFLAFLLFAVYLNWGKSWLAGGLILAIMVTPSLSFFLIDGLRALPSTYSETAKSLGLSADDRWWKLYVPLLVKPYLTGLFLSLGRAAGETAPILFVASVFYGATLPSGIKDNPVLSLPYHIFQLSQEAYQPEALDRLWSSALLIVLIVLVLQAPYYYFFWNRNRKGSKHAKLKLTR